MVSNKYEYIEENEFATLLASDVEISGVLEAQESLLIQGNVESSKVNGTLVVVEKRGKIVGKIKVRYLVVSGLVNGEMIAHGNLHVLKDGEVRGTAESSVFIVDDGGKLNCKCQMITLQVKKDKDQNNAS